jgi:hypothetical protein
MQSAMPSAQGAIIAREDQRNAHCYIILRELRARDTSPMLRLSRVTNLRGSPGKFNLARGFSSLWHATARTHTYRIFEKAGANRQAELIRRFFDTSLPAPQAGI